MPFVSEKQRKFLFANKPDIARMFAAHHVGGNTKEKKKENKEAKGRRKFIKKIKGKKSRN